MIIRLRLLTSAYVPLYVVTLVYFESKPVRIIMGIVTMVGCVSLVSLLWAVSQRIAPRTVVPMTVRDLGNEVASYVATYLLPFVTLNEPDIKNIIAFFIALAAMSVVYIRSDMIGVNPLLYLLGYRVYAVTGIRTTSEGHEAGALILSRKQLIPGCEISVSRLATGVSLVIPLNERRNKPDQES